MKRLSIPIPPLLLAAALLAGPPGLADDVTTEDVKRAIERGVQYLRTAQSPQDGSWRYGGEWTQGATALVVFSLVHAGVDPKDPMIQRGVSYVLRHPVDRTYCVSLTIMCLAAADPERYKRTIRDRAQWLLAAQCGNGQWTYARGRALPKGMPAGFRLINRGDNSNTQFAVLGLRDAERAGATIPAATWAKIYRLYCTAQNTDGGWGYTVHDQRSYGSMTCAGIAGLLIARSMRSRGPHRCGMVVMPEELKNGLDWLRRNFSVTANPGKGSYYYYYMYALERVGVLSGKRRIGDHDWYREGAAQLVRRQAGNGSWGSRATDTAFALLFLSKGGAPVAVSKLRWDADPKKEGHQDWNNDPHDADHLTKYYSNLTKTPVSWEVVDVSAPLTEWMRAPILYFNGHRSPNVMTDEQVGQLRAFVDQGGFLFVEACCGKKEFDTGFRKLVRRIFPENELVKLGPEHPIYSMHFDLSAAPPELWGITTGCRLSVIYSPRDMSCIWEVGEWAHKAFKMGANIIAYGTGDERLRGKLDRVVIAEEREKPKPPPRGALVLAQIRHGTDWNTDPLAITKLMLHLRKTADFDIGSRRKVLTLADPDLFDYPILYMTSHSPVRLTAQNKDRLRTYLTRGGFLFSDACCGNRPYDQSFRQLVRELFPAHPLEVLPPDHPIYAIGGKIGRIQYKRRVLKEEPGKCMPALEGVTVEGRTVIVYNPYDMTCAIHGHPCPACRGIVAKDAFRLATNIVLYALTH